jgi:hypothetical protein
MKDETSSERKLLQPVRDQHGGLQRSRRGAYALKSAAGLRFGRNRCSFQRGKVGCSFELSWYCDKGEKEGGQRTCKCDSACDSRLKLERGGHGAAEQEMKRQRKGEDDGGG